MVQNIRVENTVLSEELELDTSTTEYNILDTVDWGVIQASHHEYKYIDQYGVTIVGTSLGTRTISIQGWLIVTKDKNMSEQQADNLMSERKQILNRFFNPLNYMKMYYKDVVKGFKVSYNIGFYCQNTIKYGTEYKENNNRIVHYVIDGIAPDPFFKKTIPRHTDASIVTGMFHFPLIMKDNHTDSVVFGNKRKTTIFEVYNNGHVPCGMTITFRARGGGVAFPKIINIDTQEYIQINKVLSDGEVVVINTSKGSRSIRGKLNGVESNYQKYKDIYSKWIILPVGVTNMSYNASDGLDLLEVYIDVDEQYQEVQGCW